MATISEWWMWLVFLIFVLTMLAIDLFLLGGRKAHTVSIKEALSWTLVWFILALIFNVLLWQYLRLNQPPQIANERALEFLAGYLIEKSLSIDNVFIFLMIFNYFAIPAQYQHRVLMYGVLGALCMRLILILLGIWIVTQFHWILYIFGLFLLITGIKMLLFADHPPDFENNPVLVWMRKHLRLSNTLRDEHFFIRCKGVLYFTPLFAVLILIEISDLIFAVDSIPAIFAVTQDPFIVFTSNIFAIMGLRALYFLLANMHSRFHLLKYGLAFILIFVGVKMLIADWLKIPIFIALGMIISILALCVGLSIYQNAAKKKT